MINWLHTKPREWHLTLMTRFRIGVYIYFTVIATLYIAGIAKLMGY